ncbi:hypothetical protein [Paludisphaera rhizosphaerae]|uniref:hypothetical protein n=1 Tax=Paludisphaera rhizosphaerae TaxID=2711216 RepID=UPI0013EE3E59|nr:hypothetical protein [Paludisphaera rhizosphaerae]
MGVEYRHFLIAEDNTYRPGPEELARLVNALLEAGFVARGGSGDFDIMAAAISILPPDADCYVQIGDQEYAPFPCPCSAGNFADLVGRDFIIRWEVDSINEAGLKYPLDPFPEEGEDAYYDIELHMARDFVYQTAECIDPFGEVKCSCGQVLEYWERDGDRAIRPVYYSQRIHRECPACGEPFLPQRLIARIRVGHAGDAGERAGGATYLFAVVVDCSKDFARGIDAPIRAIDAFLILVEKTLGRRFYEIGEYY